MLKQNQIHCIKQSKHPTMKLYHYFSNIQYAIEAIEKDQIYLPLSESFNDPFDCGIVNDGGIFDANAEGNIEVVMAFINKILLSCDDFIISFFKNKDFESMEKQYKEKMEKQKKIKPYDYLSFVYNYSLREESFADFLNMLKTSYIKEQPFVSIPKRVACFSEVNDSILMWAYYANCHKGVCLEYLPTKLDIENDYYKELFDGISKVHYSQYQYNSIENIFEENELNNVFFNKAQCWAHEQEWRLVLSDNIERVNFPCLTGIFLGARFREECATEYPMNKFTKVIQTALSRDNKVPIYEAKLNGKKYQIDFHAILKSEVDNEVQF